MRINDVELFVYVCLLKYMFNLVLVVILMIIYKGWIYNNCIYIYMY